MYINLNYAIFMYILTNILIQKIKVCYFLLLMELIPHHSFF